MKRVIFLFCIFFPIISNSQQVVTKLNTSIFDLSYLNIGVETNGQGLGGALTTAVSSTLMYSLNGIDNIISIPNYGYKDLFPIHFIKKNNTWEIDSLYKDISIVGRNYSLIDTIGTFAYADHGREYGPRNTWPYGHIWQVANLNGKLVWTQVSKIKSFYHSVATSDLNSDGQIDFIGLHMGTYNSKNGVSNLHTYKKNKDSTFSEWYDVLSDINFPEKKRYSAGAVFAKDLYGDKNPEIIRGSYGQGGDLERHSLIFYQIDPVDKVYKYAKEALDLGVFKIDPTIGSTSIKSIDFNKDGFLDLAVAFEGYLNGVQLWKNDGKGNFSSDQYFGFTGGAWGDTTGYSFREFEVADIDHDGWEDIILHPTGFDNNFRINPEPAPSHKTKGDGIRLNKSIWKNNKGAFKFLETDIAFKGIYPGSMKGFLINNELRYFGFENAEFTGPNKTLHNFKLHDITIHFCNNLIKPTFNTTKYSFCSGDSLKIVVSNINKGDSLKWYYGTKSDLTNVSNKTFTDSTKLFVTRTDSLGCIISSDTVQIKKYGIPSAPSITRDTANFLLSGAPGTTWYKDGSAITDTAQKYKPTAAGSYTAKTTTNGCTSVMSAAYYYLVTDIINLSKDEFIKLAPNPFVNQLNFDFVVKGYQKLNIEVYDVATGSKVATQQNITAGTQIQLSQLARGTYIVRVTSNDNLIAQQFKMVKL